MSQAKFSTDGRKAKGVERVSMSRTKRQADDELVEDAAPQPDNKVVEDAKAHIDDRKVEDVGRGAIPLLPEVQASCQTTPCVHGDCVLGNTGLYKCQCQKGFTGQFCDITLDKRSARELVVKVPMDEAKTAHIITASVLSFLTLAGTLILVFLVVSSRRRHRVLKMYSTAAEGRVNPQAPNNKSNNAAGALDGARGACGCCPCCRKKEDPIFVDIPQPFPGKGEGKHNSEKKHHEHHDGKSKHEKGKHEHGKGGKGGKDNKGKKRKKRTPKKPTSDEAPLLGIGNRNQQSVYHYGGQSPVFRAARASRRNRNSSSRSRRVTSHKHQRHTDGERDHDWRDVYRTRCRHHSRLNISQNYNCDEDGDENGEGSCWAQRLSTFSEPIPPSRAETAQSLDPVCLWATKSPGASGRRFLTGLKSVTQLRPSRRRRSQETHATTSHAGANRAVFHASSSLSEQDSLENWPDPGDSGYCMSASTSEARLLETTFLEGPLQTLSDESDRDLISFSQNAQKSSKDDWAHTVKFRRDDCFSQGPRVDTFLTSPAVDKEKRLLATMQWCADQNSLLQKHLDPNRARWLVNAHGCAETGFIEHLPRSAQPPLIGQSEGVYGKATQAGNHEKRPHHGTDPQPGVVASVEGGTSRASRPHLMAEEWREEDYRLPGTSGKATVVIARPLSDPFAAFMPERKQSAGIRYLRHLKALAVDAVQQLHQRQPKHGSCWHEVTHCVRHDSGGESETSEKNFSNAYVHGPQARSTGGHDRPQGVRGLESRKRRELSISILPGQLVNHGPFLHNLQRAYSNPKSARSEKKLRKIFDYDTSSGRTTKDFNSRNLSGCSTSTEPISVKAGQGPGLSTISPVQGPGENAESRWIKAETDSFCDQDHSFDEHIDESFGPFLSATTRENFCDASLGLRQGTEKSQVTACVATKFSRDNLHEPASHVHCPDYKRASAAPGLCSQEVSEEIMPFVQSKAGRALFLD